MSEEETEVVLSASQLAVLVEQQLRSARDGECLLLGSCSVLESRIVTDAESCQLHRRRQLAVTELVACPRGSGSFYDSAGRLCEDRLEELLAADGAAVDLSRLVGWCRFRRGAPSRPSLREQTVLTQLSAWPRRCPHGSPALLLLLTDTLGGATTAMVLQHEQAAYVSCSGDWPRQVRLCVRNLGSATALAYQQSPFSVLCHELQLPESSPSVEQPTAGSELAAVSDMEQRAIQQLADLSEQLIESEADISAVYQELDELRRQKSFDDDVKMFNPLGLKDG